MIAALPLNAAYALPVASAAASCSGVTSVIAFHCASLFTRKTAWYPAFASARKRSARSWIGEAANIDKRKTINSKIKRKRKKLSRCIGGNLGERNVVGQALPWYVGSLMKGRACCLKRRSAFRLLIYVSL